MKSIPTLRPPDNDGHVSFSTTPEAFRPQLWDPGEHHVNKQNPADNPAELLTIAAALRP